MDKELDTGVCCTVCYWYDIYIYVLVFIVLPIFKVPSIEDIIQPGDLRELVFVDEWKYVSSGPSRTKICEDITGAGGRKFQ